MREICLFLLCTTLCLTNIYSQGLDAYSEYAMVSDEEIKSRLASIQNDIVKPKFDPVVRSYIKTYTIKKRERTEAMLGRTVIYYPLFEKLLAESGLPTDLKYLSVVESALNAQAVSRSGAVGLWQFMPPTGKECGLSINRTVDERKDPEKATRAAIEYLTKQFNRYGNWELALAAYNGGPGRVNRAIKRGRSKNFWKIRRHLPRETRNYVPAFIAATYINHFYADHDLNPVYPDVEFQKTEMVKVYKTLTFGELEEVTGTPEYVIEFLNPSYKQRYIPSSIMGSNLVLPEGRMAHFRNWYGVPDSGDRNYVAGERIYAPQRKSLVPENSTQIFYNVKNGDDIKTLAESFYCSESDIMKWNRLTSSNLRNGQSLILFISREEIKPIDLLKPLSLTAAEPAIENVLETAAWKPIPMPVIVETKKSRKAKNRKAKRAKKKKYVTHKIERGESLFTIAAQYEGITIQDLISLNNIEPGNPLKHGTKLKVREK